MFITPNWPAPSLIRAYTTLRQGGKSAPPFDQFNLAHHVGDHDEAVKQNRELLIKEITLPAEPIWLDQVHGTNVVKAQPENKNCMADASYTDQPNQVCAILTADCLPILICNQNGTHVAAIHAGWRGLAHGIIETTLHQLSLPPETLLAWLGPAIGPRHFEVGPEVREQFLAGDKNAMNAFIPSPNQRWLADLYQLARLRLTNCGVNSVYGGEYCTFSELNRFYSYRRDGKKTGRMATLIWISGRIDRL